LRDASFHRELLASPILTKFCARLTTIRDTGAATAKEGGEAEALNVAIGGRSAKCLNINKIFFYFLVGSSRKH